MPAATPSVNYKLCYSSNVQTLFGLLRKKRDAGDDDAIKLAASALGMTLKCWKTPTGYYHILKYIKSPLHPMYPATSVIQQFAQDNNADNAVTAAAADSGTIESTIQGRGLFRSVVINDSGNVVAFSPPKTINFNSATDSSVLDPMPISDAFVAEEFVEGTMIQLFYNPAVGVVQSDPSSPSSTTIAGWELSTKGVVGGMIVVPKPGIGLDKIKSADADKKDGANNTNHTKATFRALFLDACIKNGIEFDKLDTQYSYSLVLQHPDNPLVCNITEPRVYLIAAYSIDNSTLTVTRHPRSVVDWKSVGFRVPRDYSVLAAAITFQDVRNRYANPVGTSPYRLMGVMLHSGTGWSFKLRNPSYESAKHAPLEHGKRLLFEYCSLRRTRDVDSHLKLYPEDAAKFSEFKERIRVYTSQLYSNYVECFITRVHPLSEYVPNFKTHMYRMHNDIYKARRAAAAGTTASDDSNPGHIAKPKPNRCGLKFQDAVHYVNLVMSPTDLYYALTYVPPNPASNSETEPNSNMEAL